MKKYICVRHSIHQHEADNWLLMIPEDRLSNNAKIVYLILKKIQAPDLSCMTDAHSWFKISGMKFSKIKECLVELEKFGLVELYFSTTNALSRTRRTTFTAYLLHHFLMKDYYPLHECPHDGDSFPNPLDKEHVYRNSQVARAIHDFKENSLIPKD